MWQSSPGLNPLVVLINLAVSYADHHLNITCHLLVSSGLISTAVSDSLDKSSFLDLCTYLCVFLYTIITSQQSLWSTVFLYFVFAAATDLE